ncbi:hypothetical protein [Kitasatospora indigofera]|uniref:hypothetical protein n=1 Tax=Kitasatospora indigofera TaxID=67307 RepID=UPI00167E3B17|nr:hypothetical protein [Kitasatospora indigofera]
MRAACWSWPARTTTRRSALLHLADRCLQLEPDAFRVRLADLLAHTPDRRHPR